MNAFSDIALIAEKAILSHFSGLCQYSALQIGLVIIYVLSRVVRGHVDFFVQSHGKIGHKSVFLFFLY